MTMTPDVQGENVFLNEKGLQQTPTIQRGMQSPPSITPTPNYDIYKQILQENIEYEHFAAYQRKDIELVDELIECALDVICTTGDTVKIGGEQKSRQMVISQYMKLNSVDIEHIIGKYREQRHKITHVHSYLKMMMYTVKQEISAHYENAVRADGIVW